MIYDPKIIVRPGKKILLKDYETGYTGPFKTKDQAKQKLKEDIKKLTILQDKQIDNLEQHLVENGTIILKFFLNVSKKEQKRRFLGRINNPAVSQTKQKEIQKAKEMLENEPD